jgi:hypothetical protein
VDQLCAVICPIAYSADRDHAVGATIAVLSTTDFVRRAGELGVPVYLTTEEEWEREKATIDSWLKP